MSRFSYRSDEDYDEPPRPRRTSKPKRAEPKPPPVKQSYESNADVQRWLREQDFEAGAAKPPFDPGLLAGRRDRDWILSSLSHFYEQNLITDVLHVAKSGKEATVFCCAAHPATGLELVAAKIYRPRMFRSLRNDAVYREGRAQRDERGHPLHDRRRKPGGERGRAVAISAWIGFEFETQLLLHSAGARVPRPLAQIGNAVLMEFVGTADELAPRLSEVALTPEEARAACGALLDEIGLYLRSQRIHGDLSAYNILYDAGRPVVIDFAQAVDPRHSGDAPALLARDIDRVARFFAPYGVEVDVQGTAFALWEHYLTGA
ncbi:MAG TPA: RIO1 family regulatory kinase/ATPase [Roseiflexaceae bacterium]|nr:RIO1 family regulatory kinase/ATPase [Roseiflexaceae bacterium]